MAANAINDQNEKKEETTELRKLKKHGQRLTESFRKGMRMSRSFHTNLNRHTK